MKKLLLLLLFCGTAVAQSAISPFGVFGGAIPSTSLPPASTVGAGTVAFTTDQGEMIVSGGAWVPLQPALQANICTQSSACLADTMQVNETAMSCQGTAGAGTTAVITGMTSNGEKLLLAPYVGARAVVSGCGPSEAQNVVGGITVATAGSGYVTSVQPTSGADLIVLSGGTPINGSTFTGDIDSDGILTVSGITGSEYLGTVITGTGVANAVIIRDFISGTNGNGTYQNTSSASTSASFTGSVGGATTGTLTAGITNGSYTFKFSTGDKRVVTVSSGTFVSWAGALPAGTITTATWGVISEAMTGTNNAVVRVLGTIGPIATVNNANGFGTIGGPYTNVSLTGGSGSGAVGTITLTGSQVTAVTITTPGTNYITGDNLAFSIPGGVGIAHVATLTGNGVVYAGVVAGGQYNGVPANPVNQLVTSGTGSGAQFTMTWAGGSVWGTVASLDSNSGFSFAAGTNANAITPYTTKVEQVAIGHADDSASTAALATRPSAFVFQGAKTAAWVNTPLGYGFLNPIVLPNNYRVSMLCQGAKIMPLAPLNAQVTVAFQATTSLAFKSNINNCEFQGMGVVNYNAYISAAQWLIQGDVLENALIEPIFIGDAAGDNASNVLFLDSTVKTDTNAVPAWPAYNYEISQSADAQAANLLMSSAIWGGMLFNGADDQVRNVHGFAIAAGPCFDIEGGKTGIDGICDNMAPGQPGYFLNAGISNIHDGWQCSLANSFLGNYCVYVNIDSRSTIGCGTGANNAQWAGNYANLLFFNFTYSASSTTRAAPCSGNGGNDPPVQTGNQWVNGSLVVSGNLTVGGTNNITSGTPLLQSAIPFGVPATTVWDATGDYVIGANPATSATTSFSATSGSVTVTFSAAALTNSASDVNRVVTVLDTTYKTCLITAALTTTTATCTLSATLSGVGPFTNANSWISGSGTAAQAAGGGVTYPAALPNTYSAAYLYFSGTTAGPPQGIYYCVPASLATGTCFGGVNSPSYSTGNGTLTGSAKPVIPGSTSALVTTAGTNVPTTGSAIILSQATLTANALGTGGCLDYDASSSSTNSANSANNKILQSRLSSSGPSNTVTTQSPQRFALKLCNAGVANSQVSVPLGTGGASQNFQTGTVSRIAVATTSNQTVSFSLNMANATDSAVLEQYYIKATPGP